MSFDAMRWAAAQQAPTLPKMVLLVLANKANFSGECWPSMATLAREAGISRRHVIRCLKKLRELGLIDVQQRIKDNHFTSNMYKLKLVEKPKLKVVGGSDS
jgi:biotin operon repressor